jgi:hypothetical protein
VYEIRATISVDLDPCMWTYQLSVVTPTAHKPPHRPTSVRGIASGIVSLLVQKQGPTCHPPRHHGSRPDTDTPPPWPTHSRNVGELETARRRRRAAAGSERRCPPTTSARPRGRYDASKVLLVLCLVCDWIRRVFRPFCFWGGNFVDVGEPCARRSELRWFLSTLARGGRGPWRCAVNFGGDLSPVWAMRYSQVSGDFFYYIFEKEIITGSQKSTCWVKKFDRNPRSPGVWYNNAWYINIALICSWHTD